jgi:hypothetical protein
MFNGTADQAHAGMIVITPTLRGRGCIHRCTAKRDHQVQPPFVVTAHIASANTDKGHALITAG